MGVPCTATTWEYCTVHSDRVGVPCTVTTWEYCTVHSDRIGVPCTVTTWEYCTVHRHWMRVPCTMTAWPFLILHNSIQNHRSTGHHIPKYYNSPEQHYNNLPFKGLAEGRVVWGPRVAGFEGQQNDYFRWKISFYAL